MTTLPIEHTRPSPHPLFPSDQVLLWIPGLPGEEAAYCSYNGSITGLDFLRDTMDENHAFFSNPHPVSQETYIAWNQRVSPPFPFHAVPVRRSLSQEEMTALASRVIVLAGEPETAFPDPLQSLKHWNKIHIVTALRAMNLLGECETRQVRPADPSHHGKKAAAV